MSSDLSKSSPDVVILDPEDSGYFGLTEVAGRVWQLLEKPSSYAELREALMAEYDIKAETLDEDLATFIEDLIKRKILVLETSSVEADCE